MIGSALRALTRTPAATLVSVATIGAGIGAATILFALVSSIALRPLPYPEPDRLVRIFDTNPEAGVDRAGAASGNIDDWRERSSAFDGIAGFYATGRTISAGGQAEVLITAQVSRDFFPLLQVTPLVGRTFTDEETRQAQFNSAASPIGIDPVVVLSYDVWQRYFDGDPAAIGQSITLERQPFTVVGVMPDGFAMPDRKVALWIPWDLSGSRPRDQHYLTAIARLKAGVSIQQAGADLDAVAVELGREYPETNRGWRVHLSPLDDEMIGQAGGVLWMLFGAVGLVLVVACANVALLSLLARIDRARETAVRLALGAPARRLVRAVMVESALVAAIGGAAGAALAAAALRLIPRLPLELPRLDEVTWDAGSWLFVAGATILAAIVTGVPQAWGHARAVPSAGLLTGAGRTTDGRSRHRLRDAIVVVQVAIAAVLIAGSGLLVRSFVELSGTDHGFEPRGVLVAPVFLDSLAYTTGEHARVYYDALFDRLAALPGVTAVGAATIVPTSPLGPDFERPVWPEGTAADRSTAMPASVRIVTPGYFDALGLSVAAGRAIDPRDGPGSPRVAVVNETLARRLWPGERAVGRRLVVDYSTAGTYPYEIVGVVGDVRFRGPRSQPQPEVYFPHAQRSYLAMNVVMRTDGDPRGLVPAVRAAMRELDPQKPAHGIYSLEDLVGATYLRDRQAMATMVVFAGAAILLAILAVHAVMTARVGERSREIGIRVALGASPRGVVAWVAASGLRLVAIGLGAGLVAGWALSGTLRGLLFEVAADDATTNLLVVAVVAAASITALVVPCWRATRVDPVKMLRQG